MSDPIITMSLQHCACETGLVIRRTVLVLMVGLRLTAQTPAPTGVDAQPKGVAAAWDVSSQIKALADAVRAMEPLLLRVDAKILAENGATDAYVQQVRSVQSSIKSLLAAAGQLEKEPEKLPVALDVYFQMERMEVLVNSLREGIRKYQSPDLADMITQAVVKHAVHRDRLRQHIRDVADLHDQEYQIANEEAQRCRATLTKQPVSAPPKPATSKTPGSSSTSPQSSPRPK